MFTAFLTGRFVFAGVGFFGATFCTATLGAAFLTVFLAAVAGAVFFRAVFFGTAGSAFSACFAAAWNAAHRFLVAAAMAFLPAADSFRLGFEASGVAFDVGSEYFTAVSFAAPEDACTAFFARMMAALASRSSSRMWGALAEDRSVTSDINASILAIRLRIFFAFMTTLSVHVHSADLCCRSTHGRDEFDLGIQSLPARFADLQMLHQRTGFRVGKGLGPPLWKPLWRRYISFLGEERWTMAG